MLPDGQVVTLGGLTKQPPWVILPFQEFYSGDDDGDDILFGFIQHPSNFPVFIVGF
jgi:hypothetical protein